MASELEIARNIKEKLCYVAQNYEIEKHTANESQYTLPDRNVITVSGFARVTCPELLFNPGLLGKPDHSIDQLTWKSI